MDEKDKNSSGGLGSGSMGNSSGNLSSSMSGGSSGSLAGSNGTLSELRDKGKQPVDYAGIIGASAGGLDSVTNFITSVTGKGSTNANTNNNYTPPPPEKKVNPLLIGGIVAGVFLLIIVLILTKNGQAKQ